MGAGRIRTDLRNVAATGYVQGEWAMKFLGRIIPASVLMVLAALLAPSAWAADQSAESVDPPGRVARVDYMQGQISVQPHGTDDWVQAETNRPLTISDNVWADKDSRAELDLGGSFMRINSETSLTLTNVNNDVVQVSLHQGTLNVHVHQLYSGETWEVDTPNLAFTVSKAGEYRFDVDPNADTTMVTVWKGEGEATGQGPAVKIKEGEQVQFNSGNSLAHEARNAPRPDGFDDWCQLRDKRLDQSASARHVAPGTVGASDLDEYGTWRDTPDYGPVWVPTSVAPDWAPYSYGNWIWENPWGWTWVDAYPWGFAPFHYGRWVSWGGYWGWAPGPYWVRPWYAPALVAWWGGPGWGLGFGWGWGFGVGFGGGFGWCPLGWREPFFPWYHTSPFYFRNVNLANARIANFNRISNTYFREGGRTALYGRDGVRMPGFASKAGAITAMSRNGLERGLPVHGNSVRVSPSQLKGASALGRVEANPTREAMLGSRSAETAARPSSAAFSRSTVSRMTPPAASSRSAFSHSGENTAAHTGGSIARGSETPAAHNTGASASNASAAPAGRSVPRPPQSFNGNSSNRAANSGAVGSNVPRPSSAGGARNEPSQMAMNRNVPRPPTSGMSSRLTPSETGGRSASPSYRSVPRPSGPVQRSYSSDASRGSYSTRAYGGYGGYSSHAYGSYGSYGGSRYGAPSYHSYGGGYSAPHSSGGSGGYHGSSGGSSHGGGGSHSSGGGSHGGGHR